jgi:hypothetical protein
MISPQIIENAPKPANVKKMAAHRTVAEKFNSLHKYGLI